MAGYFLIQKKTVLQAYRMFYDTKSSCLAKLHMQSIQLFSCLKTNLSSVKPVFINKLVVQVKNEVSCIVQSVIINLTLVKLMYEG